MTSWVAAGPGRSNPGPANGRSMRCHYCDRRATFEVESDGVVVGLCERHLREQVRELGDDDVAAAIRDALGIEEG